MFTSASYNFVAGDVGAWVYISSGTNWTAGWYNITAVSSNAATLNGTIGQGVLKTVLTPSTVVGCATVASPTSATWTIDYSQQAAAQFTYTDLASTGAGLTVSSAAKPFAKQQVGNSLVITGGTNFNTGRYVIASVAASVATVVGPGNITTGVGANGTGGQGGAFASPGAAAAPRIAGNAVFIKSGTYSITSASTNVTGGCVSDTLANTTYRVSWEGYGSVRGDLGTAPLLQASGIATATLFAHGTNGVPAIRNISVDGATLTSIKGFSFGRRGFYYKLSAVNCTNIGIDANAAAAVLVFCKASVTTGGTAGIVCGIGIDCESFSNTVPGFSMVNVSGNVLQNCLSYANTGASSDGFLISFGGDDSFVSCVAYSNGRDGFRVAVGEAHALINCVAEGNTGTGFNAATAANGLQAYLVNCAAYTNGTNFSTNIGGQQIGSITGTSTFFINAAGGNFALNGTAGGGKLLKAAGFPGTFPAGTSVGYLDIGAIQSKGGGFIPSAME